METHWALGWISPGSCIWSLIHSSSWAAHTAPSPWLSSAVGNWKTMQMLWSLWDHFESEETLTTNSQNFQLESMKIFYWNVPVTMYDDNVTILKQEAIGWVGGLWANKVIGTSISHCQTCFQKTAYKTKCHKCPHCLTNKWSLSEDTFLYCFTVLSTSHWILIDNAFFIFIKVTVYWKKSSAALPLNWIQIE